MGLREKKEVTEDILLEVRGGVVSGSVLQEKVKSTPAGSPSPHPIDSPR